MTPRKALSIYLMCGRETPALAEAAVEGGADLLELGFPFSDPLADGPVVRRAGERALAEGMRTAACLDVLRRTRERLDVPLIPMTYASLLEAYGWERFAADAHEAGATSLIVADLPAGEHPELSACSSSRRRPPTRGSASPPPRPTAGSTSSPSRERPAHAKASPPRSRVSSSAPAPSPTRRSTPASASRRRTTRARGATRGRRRRRLARGRGRRGRTDALREYVAGLREALDR